MKNTIASILAVAFLPGGIARGDEPVPFTTEVSAIRIGWDSTSNFRYQVQYQSNLAGSWLNLGEPITAVGTRTHVEVAFDPTLSFQVLSLGGQSYPDPTVMGWIPPGTFVMGSPATEPARMTTEGPLTTVTISQGFWMDKFEVTQARYLDVMGTNPSYFTGDLSRPVERVTWNDAANYCSTLTERERLAGRLPDGFVFRLPTEAEWEYGCRAGTTTPFHYGNELRSGMANFDGRSEYPPVPPDPNGSPNPNGIYLGRTTAVGSYQPNAWGLYDMHGNVYEWCSDWMKSVLPGGSVTDPKGPATAYGKVIRGGRFYYYSHNLRSAWRGSHSPTGSRSDLGFRAVLARP